MYGTGMSICNVYNFSICPTQTITPLNYGNQNYSCNNTPQPDVAYNIMGGGWRVNKFGWFFTANTAGTVRGYNSSGVLQTFTFAATNTLTPLSYSGLYVQIAINGVATGSLMSQANFSISLNPVTFGPNSYTYCINTATSVAISPTVPPTGGPWTYNWQPGNVSGNPINVSPTVNTIYSVTAISSGGCSSTTTIAVNINCAPPSLCSGTTGTPVFFEDFGSGPLYGPALAPGVTNYPYQTGVPANGTYVIANSSNPSGTNAGYVNDGDHTGNTNGYMMVVNSDFAATEVYRKHVTGLCQNTTYVFSAYLANNNSPDAVTNVCGSSYVYANIKFQVEFPVGSIQNSITSGNLAVATNSVSLPWIQYGFAFTTGTGQTTADVVLINNAPGGCGNDYVVDDISLATCGPGVSLSIAPNYTMFCPGESLMLQSAYTSGSYVNPQYQWQFSNDGGVTWNDISAATSSNYNIASVASSQAGMYQLLVSENGNINLATCRIVAGPLTFSVSNGVAASPSSTICAGSTVTLTASGTNSYLWSNNATTNSISVSPSITTSYSVVGTIGTCTSQAVSTISVMPNPTVAVTGNTLICSGQSSTLTANGSGNYLWNTSSTSSSITVVPNNTQTYSVLVTIGSCTNSASATVSVVTIPSISLSPNASICQGASNSVTLTASGASSYTWANASTLSSSTGSLVTASPNTTTNYTVTGANASCTNTAVVTVSVNPSPSITSTLVTNTSCGLSNGSATVTSIPANNTYTWSSGITSTTNTASFLASGNYTVTAINGSCQTSSIITILSSIPLIITSSTVIPSDCNLNNGSIVVTDNNANSNYSWSPNVSITNSASGLGMGNYSLTIINGACTTSTVFNVGSIGGPTANITTTAPNCESNDGVFKIDSITGGKPPYVTSFNNTAYTSNTTFEQLSTGTYTLSILDSNLCETLALLTMPENNGEHTLYIPNTFTPNKDKVNDIWYVQGTCLGTFNCLIYNRWGEKIVELREIKDGWDGTYKGVSVPDGVYVYLIEVETKNGTINKAGHITVFR